MIPDALLILVAAAVMTLIGFLVADLLIGAACSRFLVFSMAPAVGAGICSFIFFDVLVFWNPLNCHLSALIFQS